MRASASGVCGRAESSVEGASASGSLQTAVPPREEVTRGSESNRWDEGRSISCSQQQRTSRRIESSVEGASASGSFRFPSAAPCQEEVIPGCENNRTHASGPAVTAAGIEAVASSPSSSSSRSRNSDPIGSIASSGSSARSSITEYYEYY